MVAMYWPDYRLGRKRKRSLLAPALLFGLLFGLLLGGALNDWWSLPFAAENMQAEPALEDEAITTVVVVSQAVGTSIQTGESQTEGPVKMARDFTLMELFDGTNSLSLSDYAGQPVILNFWASWCVPCKAEMPALERAYESHGDEGLVVLGVNQTFIDDLDAARDYVNELALTFPSVRDDTGNISEGLYQVMGLPTSVLITPDGEIAHEQIGQMTDVQIDAFSRQLVAGQTITP
jgi:thiol-disulfide isomerase/thioredoxin